MKKLLVILIMAVSLLSASFIWGQNGVAPSETLVANLEPLPVWISSIAITNNNDVVVSSNNGSSDYNQLVTRFNSQLNKIGEKKLATPYLSMSPSDCMVSSNTGNGVLVIGNDTLFVFDADGNIVLTIKTPGSGIKTIFKDQYHYYVVDLYSQSGLQQVNIYGNDLVLLKSFPVETHQGCIIEFLSENNGEAFYITSCQSGGGDSSNISSNFAKYSMSGELIWTKHLPDRNNPSICMGINKEIYLFAGIYFHTKTGVAWDVIKFNPSGYQEWEKMWLGDFPGDSLFLSMSAYDIISCGSGFIALGASTRLGQNPRSPLFNINNVDAVAIAFNAEGNISWKIRLSDSISGGTFHTAQWDKEGYLIIGGDLSRMSKIWKYFVPGVTSVTVENNSVPTSFTLSQNYPNPFNPSTTINFSITKPCSVTLKVYDLLGNEVATLVNENLNSGSYRSTLDAKNLASGVYVYQLRAGDFTSSKKMVLVK